jgi:hypothetical protein
VAQQRENLEFLSLAIELSQGRLSSSLSSS